MLRIAGQALGLLLMVFVASDAVLGEDVRHVLNMAHPGPGVARMTVDLFGNSAGDWPTVLGDVNGDGYDDFLYRRCDESSIGWPDSYLVWGGAELIRSMPKSFEDVPHCRIIHDSTLREGLRPRSRRPFASAGDLDGDGYADFLISAWMFTDRGVEEAGRVIVVFGQESFPAEMELAELSSAGVRTLQIVSQETKRHLGGSQNRVGDLDGDGFEDLAIGADGVGTQGGEYNAGRVYVIFGSDLGTRSEIDIAEVGDAVPGFVLLGASGEPSTVLGDSLGFECVEGVGDVNGDGRDDLLVPAIGTYEASGAVYVVYGRASFERYLDAAAPETFGVEIRGVRTNAHFGWSISKVGDVDGDGLQDFVIGEPAGAEWRMPGAAYLIFGSSEWPGRIAVDDPALRKVEIRMGQPPVPEDGPRIFGWWVEGVGDWNRDGFSDVAIGGPWQEVGMSRGTGMVHLVFGGTSLPGFALDTDVGTDYLPGLVLQGHRFGAGFGVAGDVGDVDGDGVTDLLITAALWDDLGYDEYSDSSVTMISGAMFDDRTLALSGVDAFSEGALEGGTRVKLRGRGFEESATVLFGGVEAPEVQVVDSALIEAVTPPGDVAGTVDVEVVQGEARVSLQDGFRYFEVTQPNLVLDAEALRAVGVRASIVGDLGTIPASGDLNMDGRGDLVLGSSSQGTGQLHVIFGVETWPSQVAAPDVTIVGDPTVRGFGITNEIGRDIDQDGDGDLILGGATLLSDPTQSSPGRTYVMKGYGGDWPEVVDIVEEIGQGGAAAIENRPCYLPRAVTMGTPDGKATLAVGQVFCRGLEAVVGLHRSLDVEFDGEHQPVQIGGVRGDPTLEFGLEGGQARRFGSSLASVGDMNGDGWPDLVVGAMGFVGVAFVVLGDESLLVGGETADILDLVNAGRAVRVTDGENTSYFGQLIGAVGDYNGDGLSDVIFSAELGGPEYAGRSYLLYGSHDLGVTTKEIDFSVTEEGYTRISGSTAGDEAGYPLGLGDWNGDGYSDVGVTGAFTRSGVEKLYVVFGEANPPREITLGNLQAHGRGFEFTAPESIELRSRSLLADDFDGDGRQDLAVPFSLTDNPTAAGVLLVFGPRGSARFVRGDANDDGTVNISDAVAILGYLFLGAAVPPCLDAGDTDDSGNLDLSDAVSVLNHLFLGAAPPPSPYPERGLDPTADEMRCF